MIGPSGPDRKKRFFSLTGPRPDDILDNVMMMRGENLALGLRL